MRLILPILILLSLCGCGMERTSNIPAAPASAEKIPRDTIQYKEEIEYTIYESHGNEKSTLKTTANSPTMALNGWDVVQELYYEGQHFEAGSWHSKTWVFENKTPGGEVEHSEVELKKDNDAKWEVMAESPSKIVYKLSASSCIFSCDEVKIRVHIRWKNPVKIFPLAIPKSNP